MKATAICVMLAAGAAFGGVQLPEGYTRLEYVTIPADYKPNNGVVLEDVQWKDIGRIVGTFRCKDTHSNQHMIFAATSGGADRTSPWIALNGGQSTRVNGVTVTPAWTPDDTYAMDGVTEHKVDFAISGASSGNNKFVFGGCWGDTAWGRSFSWSELTIFDAGNAEIAHLYACSNSTGVCGFYDTKCETFREQYDSTFPAFEPGPVYINPIFAVTLTGEDGVLVSIDGSEMAASVTVQLEKGTEHTIEMSVPEDAETCCWKGSGSTVADPNAAQTTILVNGATELTAGYVAYPVYESAASAALPVESRTWTLSEPWTVSGFQTVPYGLLLLVR